MGELKKVFRPELLNRIDEVIVFHKLTKEEIIQIVDLLMKRLREQMTMHEVAIELTRAAKELLVEKGYDPAMGARPLRRAIQRYIEDPLADFVLGSELEPGSTILVDRKADGEEVDITVVRRPGASARRSPCPPRRTRRRQTTREMPPTHSGPRAGSPWADLEGDVTVLVKTFERPDALRRLLSSIRSFYPRLPIVVIDDSADALEPAPESITRYVHAPYNSLGAAGGATSA